ncbi:hypothetical protein VNO77_13575 [Canavalia gladiata]|uniref:Uncharacterized protein n=1 Tax=Canavalia gladiata TaxID=3824 RepID=A0AAN9LYN6_CANGL
MDQRAFHLQPTGICYKLYHFITKTLASQALKTVTLGRSKHHSSTSTAVRGSDSKANTEVQSETPSKDDDKKLPPTEGFPAQQAEEKNNPCMNVDEVAGENVSLTLPKPSLQETRSIKKTVSINANVEEIPPMKKLKKKRSRSFQKSTSLEQEEEEPKPLRSILKVGSDLNDKSYTIS